MLAIGLIDCQKDFMNVNGALYVQGANDIRYKFMPILSFARVMKIPVFCTADMHDGTEPELQANGGPFPPHCMYDTPGWELIHEIKQHVEEQHYAVFSKQCYDVFDPVCGSKFIVKWLVEHEISDVLLAGVVGNICVKAAALGLAKRGIAVTLLDPAIVWLPVSATDNERTARKELSEAGVKFSKTRMP